MEQEGVRAIDINGDLGLQSSPFPGGSPLRDYRRSVAQAMQDGPAPRVEASTRLLLSPDLPGYLAGIRAEVAAGRDPLGQLPEAVSAVHTPPYSRGQYMMFADDSLRVSVELGPLLWQHAQRGAPGSLGQILDAFV
ncbi:MAG: hypothetical protein ABW005_08795 [Burkholderiaceae bacterium]